MVDSSFALIMPETKTNRFRHGAAGISRAPHYTASIWYTGKLAIMCALTISGLPSFVLDAHADLCAPVFISIR